MADLQPAEAPSPVIFEFMVERAVTNVFDEYEGWIVVGRVKGEWSQDALNDVLVETQASPGRYRVVGAGPDNLAYVATYDVRQRVEYEIETVS